MSATIRDVARRAGVSISTVSRVLNDSASVHEEKRQLVTKAARELGYVPNPAARSLLGKNTGGLGVLLPYVSGEFFAELLHGLDEAAQEVGRFLVVSSSHRHPQEFNAAIQAMDRRVDGLVVMAPELDEEEIAALWSAGDQIVFINTAVEGLEADALNFDNYGGAFALTQHLLDSGHRRIALIKGSPGAWDASERRRGYREAMAAAGIDRTDALEFEGDYTQAAGFAAAQNVLASAQNVTAIVAANDYCAAGVLSALHAAGVKVPDDIAVTGFDGVTSAEYLVPALTTVRVPIRDIGYRAVRKLAALLQGDEAEALVPSNPIPVELVIRPSTLDSAPSE